MSNLEDAREFCRGAFGPFDIDTEPYVHIIAELMEHATQRERERCAMVALEQRCERGTPWDLACTTIADQIRASSP